MKQPCVYIMANKRNGTLYIGVTNNLAARVFAHKQGTGSAFTRKYNVHMLVYAEEFLEAAQAIQRETSMKRWPRQYKINLIERLNSNWDDLCETLI